MEGVTSVFDGMKSSAQAACHDDRYWPSWAERSGGRPQLTGAVLRTGLRHRSVPPYVTAVRARPAREIAEAHGDRGRGGGLRPGGRGRGDRVRHAERPHYRLRADREIARAGRRADHGRVP